jgi:hypothetical protein
MKEGKAKSANGYKVSLEGDENMLTLECDDSYNSEDTLKHLNWVDCILCEMYF